jgi:hypothetical protein
VPVSFYIYTPIVTSRLQYALQFIFEQVLQVPYQIITSNTVLPPEAILINYSAEPIRQAFTITPVAILFQHDITQQVLQASGDGEDFIIYPTHNASIHFDVFAAVFYVLCRYEEYLPHQTDEHGRYPHTLSLLHQHNCLHLPIVNVWITIFYQLLSRQFNTPTVHPNYKFINSIDVDLAYKYKGKSLAKLFGLMGKAILHFKFNEVKQLIATVIWGKPDPFDSYNLLLSKRPSLYFILMAEQQSQYDRNHNPHSALMRQLVLKLAHQNYIGIHPSYQSNINGQLMAQEQLLLHNILKEPVTKSRQHYIKFTLPYTYEQLIHNGIVHDYSMGYGSANGFRCGTTCTHLWYNLSTNTLSNLQIFPFVWMDANCHFEHKWSIAQAKESYLSYQNLIKQYGGYFIPIWHNFMLNANADESDYTQLYKEVN